MSGGQPSPHDVIAVRGARENNLKDVSVDIPKRQLVVFTGVSGSGKSSLVFGTVAAESQRLINETYTAFLQNFMPAQARPDVDTLSGLTAAILVDQERMGSNSRSTVGTATDAYAMLRMLFSRLGEPHAGSSGAFSFNLPEGMCPVCEGTGRESAIDIDALVDRDLSLNEGAITVPNFTTNTWYWRLFADSGFLDPDKQLRDYTEQEWEDFLHKPSTKVKHAGFNATYEGLVVKVKRIFIDRAGEIKQASTKAFVERAVTFAACSECGGTRLAAPGRSARINGTTIAECTAMQVSDLLAWLDGVTEPAVAPLVGNLRHTLASFVEIGLGYLSLDREPGTLSGGEAQRTKMVRHLGSALTDVTYVFDEPTVGLHPHDIQRMNGLLMSLRDKGNTVLVVEHKPEVITVADHVVDLGPGAGSAGGNLEYAGDVAGLRASGTLTGQHLDRRPSLRPSVRSATGSLPIRSATLHNLRDVSVEVPTGVLCVITGVAGSGKSSLIHGYLPRHDGVTVVDQTAIKGSRRSNPATYTGLPTGSAAFAKANGVKPALFSANSEGACPTCQGLGVVYIDLGFIVGIPATCEDCEGRRFTDEVLEYRLEGKNISEVLAMQAEEARTFFTERRHPVAGPAGRRRPRLRHPRPAADHAVRRRAAAAQAGHRDGRDPTAEAVFVLDEPTSGLHMADVDMLLGLLDRLVDTGQLGHRHRAQPRPSSPTPTGSSTWVPGPGTTAGRWCSRARRRSCARAGP